MMTETDHERIMRAIAEAESGTSGEIVCVIARQSAGYSVVPMAYAALVALVLPLLLLTGTRLSAERIYAAQLLCFILVLAVLSLPVLRLRIVPRAVKRARAYSAALRQFSIRHVSRTRERTGLLIYISLAERVARIIADDGIAAKVPQHVWDGALELILDHAQRGEVADGCIAAIEVCGAILAEHCPADAGNPDELPNRVYLL